MLFCPFVHAGFKFWKVNSRKFLAVPEEDVMAPVRKRTKNSHSQTKPIDLTASASGCCSCNCTDALEEISQELLELQRRMSKVFELTKSSKVPLRIQELLFKCKICREIVDLPDTVTKCFKAILGCNDCVKSWYLSVPLVKNFPACNTEWGYVEIMRLHGLDELLTAIKTNQDGRTAYFGLC